MNLNDFKLNDKKSWGEVTYIIKLSPYLCNLLITKKTKTMSDLMNDFEIQKAKETLMGAGYYVDNLWQVNDVKSVLEVAEDDELSYDILDSVMQSEYLVSHIFELIKREGLDREIEII